ncbi:MULTISPECIES: hypothetical protein [Bacillus]|uniref:hypothetical protein n=1 Tax=Bacillus TaxID=1386 RepID=UPI00090C9145|nr:MULTISPECIES: hypothetical protein [Bacillus]PNU24638.1 hypothetical protein C1954_00080 [Bacillus stratosphericus]APJ12271.1 hypothetical protein BSL056_15520 [Bacillus safensis]MBG9820339.1 hypothetical protein [Bacillus safensis]MCP9283410.1 hypothetical protein [Bacillus safensis]QNH49834.1 hypothetical protein H7F25_12885 [Bacillus sp. PAMC28571]
MDFLIKQISGIYEQDIVSSITITIILLASIWLYKSIKKQDDKLEEERNQILKDTEDCCADILKNAELAQGSVITESEFYASVSNHLSSIDLESFKKLKLLLIKKDRKIKDFQELAMELLNKSKIHNDSTPSKLINQVSSFLDRLGAILKPLLATVFIMYFILTIIVNTSNEKELFIYFSFFFYIMVLLLLIASFIDRNINFKILIINLLIAIIPFLIVLLFKNFILTITSFFICSIIVVIIVRNNRIEN